MDEQFSGVNEGASVPSSDASSASTASDTAGTQEATPQPDAGADLATAQPDVTQESVSDATDGDASAIPFNEEELAQAPEQWREKFTSLLTHAKSLETDLKGAKGQWNPITEKYGDAETVVHQLARLEGLGAYATDPNTGEILYDQATGLPYLTTTPFLEPLAEESPVLVEQLAYDVWQTKAPDGQTYGDKILGHLGIPPERLDDVRNYLAQSPQSQQVAAGQPTAAELQYIPSELHSAYAALTAPERAVVQSLLEKGTEEDDAVVATMLKREAERMENSNFREQFNQQMQQQEQAEVASFWHSVETSTDQAVQKASENALAGLSKQIANQVTFSADPETNAVQTNIVSSVIAAICTPEIRFAIQPLIQALGVQIDPQLDGLLKQVGQAERIYQAYAQVEARVNTNPKYKDYRNQDQMQKARREADGKQQQVMAKLAPVALKIAKALTGANQGLREASNADLAKINSRPAVGNGIPGAHNNGPVRFPKGREFDLNYRP